MFSQINHGSILTRNNWTAHLSDAIAREVISGFASALSAPTARSSIVLALC